MYPHVSCILDNTKSVGVMDVCSVLVVHGETLFRGMLFVF